MKHEESTKTIDRREFITQLARRIGMIGLGVIAGSSAIEATGGVMPGHAPGMREAEGDYAGV